MKVVFAFLGLLACATALGSAGGWSTVDPTTIQNVVTVASQTVIDSRSDLTMAYSKVISAKQQVVAGMNYDIILEFNVYSAGSTTVDHTTQYEVFLFKDLNQQISVTSFKEIASPLGATKKCIPGGPCEHPIDADVMAAAKYAVAEINRRQNTQLTLVKVTSAYTQIVAGVNYYLTFDLTDNTNTATFTATVYKKLDLTMQLSEFEQVTMGADGTDPFYTGPGPVMGGTGLGNQQQSTQQALGAWKPTDMTDMAIVKVVASASKFAFKQINMELNANFKYGTFQNVRSQVVAGMKYRFDLYTKNQSGYAQVFDVVVFMPPGQSIADTSQLKFQLLSYQQKLQAN